MDFARKILNKYGWKDGEGLGKHKNGIVKPLKASMKFDNAGLGSDQAASDFNNHWWERVFNEAAENIDVRMSKNGVIVDLKNKDESVEISTKEYSVKKLKKSKDQSCESDNRYDNFLQSATLTESGDVIENPNKIVVTDISVKKYKPLTDEELFRACGGRTAHKGARHGLKLSGKLYRMEQQEREFLTKMEEEKKKSAKISTIDNLNKKSDLNEIVSLNVSYEKQKKRKNEGCAGNGLAILNLSKEINSVTKFEKNKRKESPGSSNTNLDLSNGKAKKNKLMTTDVVPEELADVNEYSSRMKSQKKTKPHVQHQEAQKKKAKSRKPYK